MTIRIREAERRDAGLSLEFIKALAVYEKLEAEVTATRADIEGRLFCDGAKVHCLIAEDDGTPCGFALYFFNFSTFLGRHGIYLEDLFVNEDARGSGVGTALLSALAARAVGAGCGRLEWSVLDWNAPSIGFYKSLGAQAMDGWTVYRLTGDALERLAQEARP